MSSVIQGPYGRAPSGQPAELQPGEFAEPACLPPQFGQGDAQGRGNPRVIQVQQPVAGAEWKYAHSGPSWFIPRCIVARLLTSAAVANRSPQITLTFRSVLCAQFIGNTVVPASSSVIVSAADASPNSVGLPTLIVGLPPDLMISDGMTLASLTGSIDVGDQYSAIAILCEEFTDFDWA